jgi:hypothetical protein
VAEPYNSPTKQPPKDQITGFDYQHHKFVNIFRNLCWERWLPFDGHLWGFSALALRNGFGRWGRTQWAHPDNHQKLRSAEIEYRQPEGNHSTIGSIENSTKLTTAGNGRKMCNYEHISKCGTYDFAHNRVSAKECVQLKLDSMLKSRNILWWHRTHR